MAAIRRRVDKQLGTVLVVAVVGAATAGTLVTLERRSAPPPERTVNLYRTHGCTCAFTLADALMAAGFEVRLIEKESLSGVRAVLHTPPGLRGCHVGTYLGYFIEGHVPPGALAALAVERPAALGIAAASSTSADVAHGSIADDEQGPVMLAGPNGAMQPWFQLNGAEVHERD